MDLETMIAHADWLDRNTDSSQWKHVDVSKNVLVENPSIVMVHSETLNLLVGRNSYHLSGILSPNVIIGRYCSIAHSVNLGSSAHDMNALGTGILTIDMHHEYGGVGTDPEKLTNVGCDVWIGINATILSGVKIGHGAVVGAGAVVTKDVPPYAVVGGVPAKIIKYRFDEETRNKLLELKWWTLDPERVHMLPKNDLQRSIRLIEQFRSMDRR